MQTFYRNDANDSSDKEVYCKSHVGKNPGQVKYERQPLDFDIENTSQQGQVCLLSGDSVKFITGRSYCNT